MMQHEGLSYTMKAEKAENHDEKEKKNLYN
jgi:hypothetical protein